MKLLSLPSIRAITPLRSRFCPMQRSSPFISYILFLYARRCSLLLPFLRSETMRPIIVIEKPLSGNRGLSTETKRQRPGEEREREREKKTVSRKIRTGDLPPCRQLSLAPAYQPHNPPGLQTRRPDRRTGRLTSPRHVHRALRSSDEAAGRLHRQ
jgi:hypothetical protein